MLFTFPSRYLCTIGHQGVLRLGGWSPHVQTGFHVSRLTRGRSRVLPVRGCHPLWPDFPDGSGSDAIVTGLIRVRSPLLAESRLISFPPGTEMFQFSGFAPGGLYIQPSVTPSGCPVESGCPIRKSPDQNLFGGSPELIAAYNVLHRLCTPRHPPYTLSSLTTFMDSCGQRTLSPSEGDSLLERTRFRTAPVQTDQGRYRLV